MKRILLLVLVASLGFGVYSLVFQRSLMPPYGPEVCYGLIGFSVAWILVHLFGNVEPDVQRGMLQNFVYRLYQMHIWVGAAIGALDSGVNAYYTFRKETKIEPISERLHPPQRLLELEKEPVSRVKVLTAS